MLRLRRLAIPSVLWLLCCSLAATVSAEERVVFDFEGPPGKDGVPAGWSFKRWAPWTGLGSFEATVAVVEHAGKKALHVKSVKAGFIVGTKRSVEVAHLRHAAWSWSAETLPTGGSFKQRSTNDQALQLLFAFEGGKVLGYVWDTTGPAGASGSGLSWREDVRVIVLQAGQPGRWVAETRDLVEDFRKLFGEEPPRLTGVALQCNSQHTESTGAGYLGSIVLTP